MVVEELQFAMNGQTGKFVGDLPVDKGAFWKIYGLWAAGIAAAAYLIQFIMCMLQERRGICNEKDNWNLVDCCCFDISTEKDSFYCCPTKENVLTKLAFATEEIFKLKKQEKEEEKKAKRALKNKQ